MASAHWDEIYGSRAADQVSWYQSEPRASLELIDAVRGNQPTSFIDIGGGESFLVDRLRERGWTDLAVLDISQVALSEGQARQPPDSSISWTRADVLEWTPLRAYGLWHDRAVLHFLTAEEDRRQYRRRLSVGVARRGAVILGTFAGDGPKRCSGLPVRRYTTEELAEFLGADFEILETRSEVHLTPAGAAQRFAWIAARRR